MGIYRTVFSTWCDDLTSDFLKIAVEQLHKILEEEFQKL